MSDPGPADRFDGTASYYARHRPDYGDAPLDYLVERFALDDSARVLDLGCGTGQVAVPLAAVAGEVVGMDPNEAMLDAARDRAAAAGRTNVSWVAGSDADLHGEMGPFRLATMGRSFHWMDQARTLDRLRDVLEPGGGVAILTDEEWLTLGTRDWQAAVYDVAADYLDDLPERTGPVEYDDPWDDLLASRGYADAETAAFPVEREWDADGVVGYVFSLSYCSPRTFGDDAAAFEADLRARLAEFDGAFVQDTRVEVVSGRA